MSDRRRTTGRPGAPASAMPADPKDDAVPTGDGGERVVRASLAGTAVFAITAIAGVAARPAAIVALVVALALFLAGVAAFVAFIISTGARSRSAELRLGSMFLLDQGVATSRRKVQLFGSLLVEVVVAGATAAVRPGTSSAFGILTPVYALALVGLWAARHGRFEPRTPPPATRRSSPPGARAAGGGVARPPAAAAPRPRTQRGPKAKGAKRGRRR